MTNSHQFTSEQVAPGHPDKLSDLIVENLYAEILTQDPQARVALEGLLGKGFFMLAGELTTEAYVDFQANIRNTVLNTGYNNFQYGLDGNAFAVQVAINEQSPEIAGGVFNSLEKREQATTHPWDMVGSGDQGLVFGSASNHNKDLHSAPHKLASLLAEKLYNERLHGTGQGILRPDAKTQVTLDIVDGKPTNINTILISTQHEPTITPQALKAYITDHIIKPVIEDYNTNYANEGFKLTDSKNYIINPAGPWHLGGPAADVGLVNRKIVADTTGGWGRHGGGGLNGKDFSKVDRSGVYAARHAAKTLVANGVADEVEVQIGYAIGQAKPVSVYVNTFGTEHIPLNRIREIANDHFDFRPLAIKHHFEPNPEAYKHTALFGHLGRNPEGLFRWEQIEHHNWV